MLRFYVKATVHAFKTTVILKIEVVNCIQVDTFKLLCNLFSLVDLVPTLIMKYVN